ncbi:antitoxin family protein [Methanothrix sp.]|uniref:antitoxin family protein n=1 Tax=Methanothrix sp. TaxID=90426 RepID=UPI003C73CC85
MRSAPRFWQSLQQFNLPARSNIIYEGGVFKPLQKVDLEEGTKAIVILMPERILDMARKYRIKVQRDMTSEFVGERR